jgi:hypothetical protein
VEKKPKYDYEVITDMKVPSGVRYRIRDVASDNAIATSYDIANAKLVVRALNALGVDYLTMMREEVSRDVGFVVRAPHSRIW